MPEPDDKSEVEKSNQSGLPATSKRKDLKSLLFYAVGMLVIWFIGTILTPIFPEEIIFMLLYSASFFFFGFDPTKWLKKN